MSQEQLILIAGAILSLVFSYFPGLKSWYDNLASSNKQLVMLGVLIVVAGGIFGLSCAGVLAQLWPDFAVTCDVASVYTLIQYILLALVSNQATYAITNRIGK
jgi:hypothetical protein